MPSLGVGVGCLRSADAVVSLAACASALASRLTMWSRLRIIDVSDNRIVSMESIAVLRTMQGEAPGFFSDFEVYMAEDRAEAARIGFHKV